MKFEEIMNKLSKDEAVVIAGGEVIINRKLQCIVGGVPVYDILLVFPKDMLEPVIVKSIDDLDDLSMMFESEGDIRRCLECNELPEYGYYVDNEMKQYYCSFPCLVKWMNRIHGQGNWQIDSSEFIVQRFLVKVKEEDLKKYPDAVKIKEEWWRYYDMKYVFPYDFIEGTEMEIVDGSATFGEPDTD